MSEFLNKRDHSPSLTCHLGKKKKNLVSSEHRSFFVRNFPSVRASQKKISRTNSLELVTSQAQAVDRGSSLSQSDFQGSEII